MPRKCPRRARHRTLGLGALAFLGALPAHAELPPGWEVETFAGRSHDLEAAAGVVAAATDGGVLLFDPGTAAFVQIADASCGTDDCLRSNRLSAIARDASGGYWLGTQNAGVTVMRSDAGGLRFGHFFVANLRPGGGFLDDAVTSIAIWRDEAVYAGTPSGVAQIDLAGGVETYAEEASRRTGVHLPNAPVRDVAVDSLYVWVASDSGVTRYLRQPPYTSTRVSTGLEGTTALSIRVFTDGVYAGTDVGLHEWNEGTDIWSRITNSTGGTPNFKVNAFVPVPGGRRFMVASTAMYYYNGFLWGPLNPPVAPAVPSWEFETAAVMGETVWTTRGNEFGQGAYLEAWTLAGGWRRHTYDNIPVSEVTFVDVDRRNSDVWVGTLRGGVARRKLTGQWCIFDASDPDVLANMTTPSGQVRSFRVDAGGSVWFSTLPQLATAPVDRVDADPDCVHADDVWDHIAPGEFGFGGRYRAIEVDADGNRFFLSDGDPPSPGGLEVLSPGLDRSANLRADVVGGNSIGAIAFSKQGPNWRRAYVGVDNVGRDGLQQWLNNDNDRDLFEPTDTNFTPLELPFDVTAYRTILVESSRASDGSDVIWVGTDSRLFRYSTAEDDTLLTLGEKRGPAPGLLSGDVKDLVIDDAGSLWIATVNGLNRIDLNALAAGRPLSVDAFSTREKITELNAGSGTFGRLYDPTKTIAPLPDAKVNSLAYDATQKKLYAATELGVAILSVDVIDAPPSASLVDAALCPNPVRADRGDLGVFLVGLGAEARANVTVFNLEGDIVFQAYDVPSAEQEILSATADSRETGCHALERPDLYAWDLLTLQGFVATSGTYFVRIETDLGNTIRPLVVVR
jgi:ligand-binding sensor domain-containing protein